MLPGVPDGVPVIFFDTGLGEKTRCLASPVASPMASPVGPAGLPRPGLRAALPTPALPGPALPGP